MSALLALPSTPFSVSTRHRGSIRESANLYYGPAAEKSAISVRLQPLFYILFTSAQYCPYPNFQQDISINEVWAKSAALARRTAIF